MSVFPPECQFYKSESGCIFGTECSFSALEGWGATQQRPKKGGDKSAAAIVKDVRQLGCVSQDSEPPESVTISRKGTKVLGPNRRVRFTRSALRQANIRENKGPPPNKIQVKLPHQRNPYAVKFEDRSRGELKDKSDAPAEMRGDLPRLSISSKKRKNCILFTNRWVDFAGRIHNKTGGKRICGGLRSKRAYCQQERR